MPKLELLVQEWFLVAILFNVGQDGAWFVGGWWGGLGCRRGVRERGGVKKGGGVFDAGDDVKKNG